MGEILVSNRRAASTHRGVHFAPVQSPRHFSRFSRQSSPVAISSRVRVEATFHGLHLVCFEHHTGERHIARLERHEGRLQDTVSASPSPNHPSRYYIVTRRFAPDRGDKSGAMRARATPFAAPLGAPARRRVARVPAVTPASARTPRVTPRTTPTTRDLLPPRKKRGRRGHEIYEPRSTLPRPNPRPSSLTARSPRLIPRHQH